MARFLPLTVWVSFPIEAAALTQQVTGGCSDGTDDVVFVVDAVVGCDASWNTHGIANAEFACGAGYQICQDNTDAEALGLTYSLCANSPGAGDFYASWETSGGNWNCNTAGANDLWGCGKDGNGVSFQSSSCGAFNKAIGNKNYGSWTNLHYNTQEVHYVTKSSGNGGVLCCCATPGGCTGTSSPTPYPTAFPTAFPTPSPTPSPTYPPGWPTPHPTFPAGAPMAGGAGGSVAATGDPHLQNIFGERFDLMQPGKHVLIQIPQGEPAEKTLLNVEALAQQLGGHCSDMYFQEVNISGAWAEARQTGGLRFQVQSEGMGWTKFGVLEMKIARGHTQQGTQYLNFYIKHLDRAGFAIGGLLGEDDHTPHTGVDAYGSLRSALPRLMQASSDFPCSG